LGWRINGTTLAFQRNAVARVGAGNRRMILQNCRGGGHTEGWQPDARSKGTVAGWIPGDVRHCARIQDRSNFK